MLDFFFVLGQVFCVLGVVYGALLCLEEFIGIDDHRDPVESIAPAPRKNQPYLLD